MADLSALQWAGAGFAALLVGLSKAGFGTGAGLLAVPLMATVLGPERALGLMLLVLITGDVFSIIHYPRSHDLRVLMMLVPGLVCGVAGGYFLLGWFQGLPQSELWLKRLIGFLSVAFVGFQLLRTVRERQLGTDGQPYIPRPWHGVAIGICGGITSTLAHAGGPVIALFLLPQRLPKRVFVGTFIKYFFIGNLAKLIPYSMKGLLTREVLTMSLALLPAVVVGTLLGVYLHGKFSDRAFRATVYVLAVCIGLSLIVSKPKDEGPDAAPADEETAALWQRGLEAYARGDATGAETAFRTLAERPAPDRRGAEFNHALALYAQERFGEAERSFAGLASGSAGGLRARAALNAGNCAYRRGRPAAAASWYSRALALAGERRDGVGREVARRARHNMRLCEGRPAEAVAPNQGAPAPGGTVRAAAAGHASAPVAPGAQAPSASGAQDRLSASAPAGPAGRPPGIRPVRTVLAVVTQRDSGPVLVAAGVPAAPAGRAW